MPDPRLFALAVCLLVGAGIMTGCGAMPPVQPTALPSGQLTPAPTVPADVVVLDPGFNNEGFGANLALQIMGAVIGGLIAVAGAFVIASRTFKQQVEHDFELRREQMAHDLELRREEDKARMDHAVRMKQDEAMTALEMLAVELVLNEKIADANALPSTNPPFPFRTAAFDRAMSHLNMADTPTRVAVIQAYVEIDHFNGIVESKYAKLGLHRVSQAIHDAKQAMKDLGFDPAER